MPPAAATPPLRFARYVALGDSSTEGIDDPDGAGAYRGWSQRLAERIDATQDGGERLLYANLAARGLTTAQVRARQLDAALALQPDLATVFCGTNDVTGLRFDATAVGADIEHMQRALVAGGATVLSFTLPDLTPLMPIARLIAPRIVALNRALAEASRRSGAILVDFAALPVATDRRLWSEDRIHANSLGHARIAGALAQALNLPGSDDAWARPLPDTEPPRMRREALAAEARWLRRHLLPWLWQGLAGGDAATRNRGPKRPVLDRL
ncbi:MAG: SGNH/GDSL hydrolase family protein [Burkholderiales bacterium]|nr:SGNH/GDSL hydrolase family protein [Opitutaceae bacterium]